MPSDEFPTMDDFKKGKNMFLEDPEAKDSVEEETEYEQPSTEKERIREILKQPQHMPIDAAALETLNSGGEVSLRVYLDERQLAPGEMVIVDDDNMHEHKAEVVEAPESANKSEGIFLVKVRLAKPE